MRTVLILSSSGLTDRILAHTNLLPQLRKESAIHLWTTSAQSSSRHAMWKRVPAQVRPFPEIRPAPFLVNYLRRLNEFAWDFHLLDPSRLSMRRHIRDKAQLWFVRALRYPGRIIAAAGAHEGLEALVERMMLRSERSSQASEWLCDLRPDLVVATGTFRYEEPAVVAAAKRRNIPVLGYITSWDNISVKNRTGLQYDGYIVWSERMKQELLEYYPQSRSVPVYIVGAPQFDILFQRERYVSRERFYESVGLRADKPTILHAMGKANGIDEQNGALDLARRVAAGDVGDVQLLVRPHPFQNEKEMRHLFSQFGPRVAFQQCVDPTEARPLRSQDEDDINEWVNTFRHADAVVHLYSTVAIDAAIFDRPVVGMDYDPQPGRPAQQLVKEVNHRWTHYKPVAESGGMWLVNDPEEMIAALRAYLENPALHREERRRMAEYVCGYLDGRCADRMAAAIVNFLNSTSVPAAHAEPAGAHLC